MRYFARLQLRLITALILTLLGSGFLSFNLFFFIFSWWTARLSFLLSSLFFDTILQANLLTVNGELVALVPACIAAGAYLLLALLILFTKDMGFFRGITMFFAGSLMILIGNLIRILALISLLVTQHVNYFDTLHLLSWKVLSSIYVVAVWIFLCKVYKITTIPLYSDLREVFKFVKH